MQTIKFTLAGENICGLSSLSIATPGKKFVMNTLGFFIHPFPPRDGHCFSLSLSLEMFFIRSKNHRAEHRQRPSKSAFGADHTNF